MEKWLSEVLKKLIPKNIAGILGLIGTIIPIAREFVMVGLRLVDVVLTVFGKPDIIEDMLIVKVGQIFDKIMGFYNKIKDFFLKVGE